MAKAPQNWAFFLAQLRHSEAWQWPVWNLARTALACSILLCRNMEKPSIKTTRMILFCRKDRLLKEPVPQGFLQLARIQSLNLKKQTSIPSGPAALSRGGFLIIINSCTTARCHISGPLGPKSSGRVEELAVHL